MWKLVTHRLLTAVMLLTLVILVDDCIEGNCQNGYGRGFTYNGRVYDGIWFDGEPHGNGKLYNFSTGRVTRAFFEHGELIEEQQVEP